MTKVLNTSLPWLGHIGGGYREGMRWSYTSDKPIILSFHPFPFYMAYSAAMLKKHGHDVHVIEALYDRKVTTEKEYEQYLNDVEKLNPELLIAEISTPSYKNDIKIFKDIKQRLPSIKIAVTGQHANALPEEIIKENEGIIDYVLVGEYEFTGLEVANGKREDGSPLVPIMKNLTQHDIDAIPWPAREMFDMSKYNDTFCDNYPNMHLLFSRGCFFSCVTGDTLVTLANRKRTQIRIDEFVKNPKPVLSYKDGKYVKSNIQTTQIFEKNELIEIETEDGKFLKVTPDHLIFTQRGWIDAGDLKEDDQLVLNEGKNSFDGTNRLSESMKQRWKENYEEMHTISKKNKVAGTKEHIAQRVATTKQINSGLSKEELSDKYGTFFKNNNPMNDPTMRGKVRLSKLGEKNPMWRPKTNIECEMCHTSLLTVPSRSKQKYCSRNCLDKATSLRLKKSNPMHRKEVALQVSNTHKQKWQDAAYRESQIQKWHKSPNSLESQIIQLFEDKNVPFKFTGDGSFWVTTTLGKHRCPDFVNLQLKKVILICGEYWHSKEEVDQEVKEYNSRGFEVLVFFDKEIICGSFSPPYKLREDLILQNINQFMRGATS